MDEQHPLVRDKRCAACGQQFACRPGGCWCTDVRLTAVTLAQLRQRYADCLCETCLRRHASDVRAET
jgi:hypothetical protein